MNPCNECEIRAKAWKKVERLEGICCSCPVWDMKRCIGCGVRCSWIVTSKLAIGETCMCEERWVYEGFVR